MLCVGLGSAPVKGIDCEIRSWREDNEARDLADCHVRIMPLRDTLWERGKCGYKLIQYLACARLAVASPMGVNRDIVRAEVNGFLASGTEEWVKGLSALCDDEQLRRRLGQAGRAVVENEYSLSITAPRRAALLRDAAEA